jgi:hypothetical protein
MPTEDTPQKERIVPLAIIEDEARKLGLQLDAKSLLLGFTIGRLSSLDLQDEGRLRFTVQMLAGPR